MTLRRQSTRPERILYRNKKYGDQAYNDLVARASFAKKGKRYYAWELEAIIVEYKKKLEALKQGRKV